MVGLWQTVTEGDLGRDDVEDILGQPEGGWEGRDAILFAIDSGPSMSQASYDLPFSPVKFALHCVFGALQHKAISSPDDYVGLLLYNVGKEDGSSGFSGINVVLNMEPPDVLCIKRLRDWLDEPDLFDREIGSAKDSSLLSDVLWACTDLLTNRRVRAECRRIFLFTDADNPHDGNVSLQRAIVARAKGLQESGITLELFGVSHSKTSPFDEEHFWTTVVSTPGQEEAHEISSGTPTSEGLEEILGRIRRKEIKRRALSRLKLTLGPGVELPVRLFSPLVEARKRQHTWVDTKSGRPMRPLTRWTNVETGAIVSDQSVRPYFDFGGAKAIFTEDELASMKYFGPPGLTLIGFKPLETLDLSLNLIPALFVYPDELGAPGSVCAFSALLTVMLEERMIAYCRYIPKSSVTPRLVALVPQAEAFDSNEAWRKLSGLHLITLPYSEEIRAVSLPKVEMEPKDGAIDALVAVIDRLTLRDGFNPLCYENPALRKHCAGLQALALVSQDTADAITDSTVPKVEEMLEKADEALSRVHQLLPQPARHASQRGSERVGSKRKTPSASFP